MLMLNDKVKLYLYLPSTDMRKSIDTLCILVSDQLTLNPADGHLFIFRNKAGNLLYQYILADIYIQSDESPIQALKELGRDNTSKP